MKLIPLLAPLTCRNCQFCKLITLEIDNKPELVIDCQRLDCDNFITEKELIVEEN